MARTLRLTEAQYAAIKSGKKPPASRRGQQWPDLFATQLDAARIGYEREYRFINDRRFRFDFRILDAHLLAVEIDGVVHRIQNRFDADRKKFNLACLYGWRVLHFSPADVRSGAALKELQVMLLGG